MALRGKRKDRTGTDGNGLNRTEPDNGKHVSEIPWEAEKDYGPYGEPEKPVMLDIFITHWTEAWEIGKKAFDILALQRMVDWDEIRVWLVHDGSDIYPNSYFSHCPFVVNQVKLPHGGIAAARNWGIEHGTGAWIKWCDFDDMLEGVYSLKRVMDALHEAENFDLLWFEMTAEDTRDPKADLIMRDERGPVLIHNKVFRRRFLQEHRIRYNEELTWCEDSAFLAVVEMEIDHKKIGRIKGDMPIYAWIVRDGSLCNRKEIQFENAKSFFKRHRYVQEEFRKRGFMGPYYVMTIRIMADCYKQLHIDGYETNLEEYEREIGAYWKEHRKDFLKVDAERMDWAIAAVEREGQCRIDREKLKGWLREMTAKYGGKEEAKDV